MARTPPHLGSVWVNMRSRCCRTNAKDYHRYGGKGVLLCDEWKNYKTFKIWALANGYQKELQLDRIDSSGNYEPANCRFVTRRQNCNNRRNTRFVTAFGETKPLSLWAEDPRCTVCMSGLVHRLYRLNQPPEIAISSEKHPEYAFYSDTHHECRKCKKILTLEFFNKDKYSRDGISFICKKCNTISCRERMLQKNCTQFY